MEHALRSDGSTLTSQLDLTQWPTEIAPGRSTRYAADGGTTPRALGVPGRTAMQAKPGGGGLRIGGSAGDEEAAPGAGGASGRPLPGDVRTKMERSFGVDFAAVRVHEGPQAAAMGAEAYAHGDAVHFRPGAYDPHGAAGQELLGHELAHVVQQRAGRVGAPQGKGGFVVDAGLEAEADAAGARAARGEAAAVSGATSTHGTSAHAAQPKLIIAGAPSHETSIPTGVTAKVLELYDQSTLDRLTAWLDPTAKAKRFKTWPDAARAAFNASRKVVDANEQSLLWYGKDSAARNVDPDHAAPPGAGQFRESSESRALADALLEKLGEERAKDALGKNTDGWKEAIMVGVMITVLGKKYAAKSGDMTLGFTKAAQALDLPVVDPSARYIRGYSPVKDRSKDPVAKAVDSRTPQTSASEVGQAPGMCALPKLLSAVSASKNDAPESATEKLFAPESNMTVKVKGEGGEVALHGHGCSVPSCITCRALTERQLDGAPTRDKVLSDAETGYAAKLDETGAYHTQREKERFERETVANRRRVKKGNEPNPIEPAKVYKADRATTWKTISERVAATGLEITRLIDTAATGASTATTQKLGVWSKPLSGVSAQPTITLGEEAAVTAAWRDKIAPAIAGLSAELARDYKVPTYAFPATAARTMAALRKHVADNLPALEDHARSSVARQFGSML